VASASPGKVPATTPGTPAAGAAPRAAPDLAARPAPADPLAAAVAPPPEGAAGKPRPAWLKPVAIGAGVLAVGLAAVSVQQGVTAHGAYADADAMVLPGGVLAPGTSPADYAAAVDRGDAARQNAWIAGTAALVTAAGAAVLCWLSP
jgi:hypothetical protein